MKTSRLITELETIKKFIMTDKKIDIDEANNLLKYIYVEVDHNSSVTYRFSHFKSLLEHISEDGKIDDKESSEILNELDGIISFLKIERIKDITVTVIILSIFPIIFLLKCLFFS